MFLGISTLRLLDTKNDWKIYVPGASRRRLECALLLYVAALRALPLNAAATLASHGSGRSSAAGVEDWEECGRASCALMRYLLTVGGPAPRNLLRQLLHSGVGTPMAAALAAAIVDVTQDSLQVGA
jgi:hypothetical protein